MASSDYSRGSMDISDQSSTWNGFVAGSVWGSGLLFLIVGYSTLTLAMGLNWIVALVLCAGLGIIGGVLMGMGGAWALTVLGLTALAIFIQLIITVSKLLIG